MYGGFVPSGYCASVAEGGREVDTIPVKRAVGRPRKWASEAERKRAYRERLAADLDEPITLRRELRTERRRTAGLQQENRRLRAALAAAQARADEAEHATMDLRRRVEWLAANAERDGRQASEALVRMRELQAELDRLHATRSPLVHPPSPHVPQVRAAPVRCDSVGCVHPAVNCLQGPRGVERNACDAHQPNGRERRRWRVVRHT